MPEKLFDLAEKEHILVGFFDLSWNILGVYYSVEPDMPVILLHKKIMHQRRLLRCIFAEELGHHFTTGFDLMAFARTDKKYIAMKYEKMAVFWAVEYLMPLDKLIEVVNSGLFLTHEIAEFFDITERFAGTGIKLYFEKRKNYILKHLNYLPEEME